MNIFINCLQRDGRVYEVGERLVEIPADVIERLIQWNDQNVAEDDIPFALATLFSLTSPEELSAGKISEDVLKFIRELLQHRTNNDENRIEAAVDGMRKYI